MRVWSDLERWVDGDRLARMSNRQDRDQRRKAAKAKKARSREKKLGRLAERGSPTAELVARLRELVASRKARIVLATIDDAAPSLSVMWEEHGIDMQPVPPTEDGQAQLHERALRHVSAAEWQAFMEKHWARCNSRPPSGVVVSSIGWHERRDLLADSAEFDPHDDWEVLATGQDAGHFSAHGRTVSLTGGSRYQVQLADPTEIPDGEGGPDAPHGFTGILVAVSARVGMVALDAGGDVRLARGHEIVALL